MWTEEAGRKCCADRDLLMHTSAGLVLVLVLLRHTLANLLNLSELAIVYTITTCELTRVLDNILILIISCTSYLQLYVLVKTPSVIKFSYCGKWLALNSIALAEYIVLNYINQQHIFLTTLTPWRSNALQLASSEADKRLHSVLTHSCHLLCIALWRHLPSHCTNAR